MSTMLVGSHAETGDERKAALAPLAGTIENVQAGASCATGRASDVAAYKAKRDARRDSALDRLAALSEDMGGYQREQTR